MAQLFIVLQVEKGISLEKPANSCGRPGNGTPYELASGGGHQKIADMVLMAIDPSGELLEKEKKPAELLKTPSHGSPVSINDLNTELNKVGRNTDDIESAKWLVGVGAELDSTNGPDMRHTPLHQACYHGRFEMAEALIALQMEKGISLELHSSPCGRGEYGTPYELAKGGGHQKIADLVLISIDPSGELLAKEKKRQRVEELNNELNNVARNSDDIEGAKQLVEEGAELDSTNGPDWRHTPLHQACYHGRFEMAEALIALQMEKGISLELHSNSCGRGEHGTPYELAKGGGHQKIAEMLNKLL